MPERNSFITELVPAWSPKTGHRNVDILDDEDILKFLKHCAEEGRISVAERDVIDLFLKLRQTEVLENIFEELAKLRKGIVGINSQIGNKTRY